MGMYPVQNYGEDFNKSMIGMGTFINGMQKSADDQAQRGVENARADRTLKAQEDTRDAAIRHSDAQTDKIKREEERAKLLESAVPVYGKVANNEELNDDDVAVLGKMRVTLPYLTNNLEDSKKMADAHATLIAANERAKAMPAGAAPFKIMRGQSPETDKVIDAANVVTSAARHKTHVDADGSVTGTKGAKYATDEIQAFAGQSTEGGAQTAAFFSVVDDNGNPVFEKDANGADTTVRKLVPSTIGETNDPAGRINFVPADAAIMKSKLALEQLEAEKKLTPEQRARMKREIETGMYGLMPGGVEKMLAANQKDTKPITLADGASLVTPEGKVIAENEKKQSSEYKSRTRQSGMKEVFEESQDGGRTWKTVSDGPKFNPKPDRGGKSEKEMERESRSDIDKSAAELAKRRVSVNRNSKEANASGDPDAIKEATRDAEAYNSESAALTAKFEAHKREFGRSYTPTAAPGVQKKGMEPNPSPAPAAKVKPAADPYKATRDGNSITYQGKSYPLAKDGTITINGKKYRVQ